jgi:aconitate hydratase
VLGMFADGLTTDHISPSSEIPQDSPAGLYLQSLGITRANFNTYVSRRGNHHVMVRGTYANVRLKNLLTPDKEGWWTKLFPDGTVTDFFAAANTYRERGVPTLILAGKDFGSGSSRDWAVKGQVLLGIGIILARSFERIHRSNLVGMGILPLMFRDGDSIESLGLNGTETYSFQGFEKALRDGSAVKVTALTPDAKTIAFEATIDARSDAERILLQNGGMFRASLDQAMEVATHHSQPLEPSVSH